MKNHSLESWIEAMENSEIGKATLVNILHDIQESRLSNEVLIEFFEKLNEAWIKCEKNCINMSLNENILSDFFNSIKSSYFCNGTTILEDSTSCSRMMDSLSFIERNWNKRRSPLDITGQRLSEKEIKKLETVNLAIVGKGEMRTKYNFTWVTKTCSINEIRSSVEKKDLATVIRNKLGLSHFKKECMLIEIIYPIEETLEKRITLPTFLEGCFSDIYCSVTVDNWGRTIDLDTFQQSLPEAIHCLISFGKGFSLKYLGVASHLNASIEVFTQRLANRWEEDCKKSLGENIDQFLSHKSKTDRANSNV